MEVLFYEVESMSSPDLQVQEKNIRGMLRLPKLGDIPMCLLLFLASRASVLGVFPFGLAMFCAAFDKSAAYLALSVAAIGSFSTGAGFMGIKQILAVIFFWLYTKLRDDYKEMPVFSSVVCGASMFAGGCILMICDYSAVYDFIALIIESVVAALMYVVFEKGVRLFELRKSAASRQEIICAAICAGVFISGIQEMSVFGINIAHCIIAYIVMSIALSSDVAVSGSGGLCTGLMCSLNEAATVTLIGFYGLCGLLCSALKSMRKYGVVLGFLSSGAIILLYVGNSFEIPVSITEMLVSAGIFIAVPEKLHKEIGTRVSGIISDKAIMSDEKITMYINDKLFRISDAFSTLSETFKCVSDKRMRKYHREAASIIKETVERVCRNCADCSRCWQTDFGYSWKICFTLLETYEKKGFCTVDNVGSDFLTHCIIPENFIAEFNHSYELFRIETIHNGEAILARDLISEQYNLFSEITQKMARRLDEEFSIDHDTALLVSDKLSAAGYKLRSVKVINCGGAYEIYILPLCSVDPNPLCDCMSEILMRPVFFEEMLTGGVMKFCSDGVFTVSVGVSQIPKTGETVCGDSVFRFKTDDMKYFIIICDGMGSGATARSESMLTGSLLKQFLCAGLNPKTAIAMVNSSLSLKQDRDMFSSVDMVCIDLTSGKTEFFKIGGAKSFIRHDYDVETVFCESLPVGMLSNVSVVSVNKLLNSEDVIIMMSDGVSDTEFGVFTSEKMKKLLADEDKTTEELADTIMKTTLKKRGNIAKDDMTVAAIQIKKGV